MPRDHPPAPASPIIRRLIFAGLLIAMAIGLRLPGLEKTIWNLDEASTFLMAEIVRDGGVLYLDAADNRTPLVPYVKALMFSFVGDWNIRSVHLMIAAMLGLTAVLLWIIGNTVNDRRTGALAAIFFTLLSFSMLTVVDTMSAHTGWFLIFFSSIGMWLFLIALHRTSSALAISAGLAFGLATMAKQPGLLDWGVCIIICLLSVWISRDRWRNYTKLIAMLSIGLVIPLGLTFWYFQSCGAWDDFVRYAWNYNTQLYVPEVPPFERLLGIRVPFQMAWDYTPYALFLGAIGAIGLLCKVGSSLARRDEKLPVLPWLILGWTASGLASTILSGRDFAHYSIQVLPGLSLACAWITTRLWEQSHAWRKWARLGARIGLNLGIASLVVSSIIRSATFDTQESLSEDIGKIIAQETTPDERIFVWGYEPELYVFSQRLPSTRFIYAVFLTGLIPWTNLDPLEDTTYAIVPGSWDDLWHDFERDPPALIVDTHRNRGFLKYPLHKQTRLWESVTRDYIDVTNSQAKSLGYSLYKRQTEEKPFATYIKKSDQVRVSSPPLVPLKTIRITVNPPIGASYVTLLLNGNFYRRVSCPLDFQPNLDFFILEEDLTVGEHVVTAISEGKDVLRSTPFKLTVSSELPQSIVIGPPIVLEDRQIDPFDVETSSGTSVINRTAKGSWHTDTPISISYHRSPELAEIEFKLQILPEAYDGSYHQKTDGVDVVVRFENESQEVSTIYKRHLDPVRRGMDQGSVSAKVVLPSMEYGIITLLVTPGPMSNAAYDWIDILEIKGEYSPLTLSYHGKSIRPTDINAKLGIDPISYQERQVVMAHAPSRFDIPQVNGLAEISGEFGFLDSAWMGAKKSSGAIFTVEQVKNDGSSTILFTQTLHPAEKPSDREIKEFRVPTPSATDARLRFSIQPANPGDNGFNHTFWHALQGWDYTAHILKGEHQIASIGSDAPNGFAIMDEGGRDVLFAHAPSRLVFPLPAESRRLIGKIGLLRRAYTGDGNTDGVTFIIESEDAAGQRTVLLKRLLKPKTVPADQGAQDFSVVLPKEHAAKLTLRTEPSSSNRLDYTWSYWSDLQFNP